MPDRNSYLSDKEIRQCADFAWKSWIYHNPHRSRERKPMEVWYDVLQGKLSELTLYNFCLREGISTNLQLPSFEVYKSHNAVSNNSLHDLVIEGRRKEVKSTRQSWKVVRLKAKYFENGKYIYGKPEDLIFTEISLIPLNKLGELIQREIDDATQRKQRSERNGADKQPEAVHQEDLEERLNQFLIKNYSISLTELAERYGYSIETLLEDSFLRAMISDVDLTELGYKAAVTPTLSRRQEQSSNERKQFTVLGEVSVAEFLNVARRVEAGHALAFGFSHNPIYEILLRSFFHFFKTTEERQTDNFWSFANDNYHVKGCDYPTLTWRPQTKFEKTSEMYFEKLRPPVVESAFIYQPKHPEYIISKWGLHPLGYYKNK